MIELRQSSLSRSGVFFRLIASAVLLTAVIGLPAALSPAAVQASSTCTGWTSNSTPPATIRVLRNSTGIVQTVDFNSYVKVVMAAEFSASWPAEVLRAGAVVVKEYGWYYTIHYRGGTGGGGCYDVKDNTNDQIYQPESRHAAASQIQAVDKTWGESLLRGGLIFLTGYRSGTTVACGSDKDGYHLMQGSAYQCAKWGHSSEYILHKYYDPIVIQGGPVVPDRPAGVSAVAYDQAAQVSWSAPVSDGRAAISLYTVTSSPDGKTCNTTGALTCTVAGLTNGIAYTFAVTATNSVGAGAASDPSAAVTPAVIPGATFHPMTPPIRLLDTRVGNGLSGKFYARTPRTFQVTGRDVIPIGATAVTGNLTVTNPTSTWAVYLGPSEIVSPASSTLNFVKGDTTANGVTVALSPTGTLSATYMAGSGNTTDLVFDLTGYFTPDTTGATYHPLTPARLLDTRVGNGLAGKLKANTPRTFPVWLRGNVPGNATAVTGNLTVTGATNTWAVYIGPYAVAKPSTSTVNFKKGQTVANNLTVALDPAHGTLSVTYMASPGNTTDLVFDVTGYYTQDLSGAKFVPITPVRLLDTRSGNGLSGKLAATVPTPFQITGRGLVPPGVIALTGNVTVVNQTSSWAVFVGPGAAVGPSSSVNFIKGQVRANGLTVALSPTGTLSATYLAVAGCTTDLVVDVTGYFELPEGA